MNKYGEMCIQAYTDGYKSFSPCIPLKDITSYSYIVNILEKANGMQAGPLCNAMPAPAVWDISMTVNLNRAEENMYAIFADYVCFLLDNKYIEERHVKVLLARLGSLIKYIKEQKS